MADQADEAKSSTPCLTIVIPTYRPHLLFAKALLDSIARLASDANAVEIVLVVENENAPFVTEMGAMFPLLHIRCCETEQIMGDLAIRGTPTDLLRSMGRFSFQAIKKIGAIVTARTDWTLVLDSESVFLREFSFRDLLNDYRRKKYVFFTRIVDRGPNWRGSLSEAVTRSASCLIGGQAESWYLEYYHWFYERDVWRNIVALIASDGKLEHWLSQGTAMEVFENVLYYHYVRNRPELGYIYVDSLAAINDFLPGPIADRARQALQDGLQVVGLLEHITSLVSLREFALLQALFDAYRLPFIRIEPYTIDPAVLDAVKRFPSICAIVSSHRSRVMHKPIAVCISGEFRSVNSNIRSIRDFTSGVACDLLVHAWNTPAIPAIVDGLTPAAIDIDDRPDFAPLVDRIVRAETGLKPMRDFGSLCLFRGIERSIGLVATLPDQPDLVVRMRPDAIYQQSLRDLVVLIAEDQTFDDATIYVPDRFHSQGVNDQFAVGSATAMAVYGEILHFVTAHIADEYFNPEHLLARHLVRRGLRLKLLPMDYLLLRSEPTDFRRLAELWRNQDTTWWSARLPGPDHIRDATALFHEKALAIELMQEQGCFGEWRVPISTKHLIPEAAERWTRPVLDVEVRRDHKNPVVSLRVQADDAELFLDVRNDGLALVSECPEGILLVSGADGDAIRVVRFIHEFDRPAAELTLQRAVLIDDGPPPSDTGSAELIRKMLLDRRAAQGSLWQAVRAAVILRQGQAQRRRGELHVARQSYARLLALDPKRAGEWVQYGDILRELGELRASAAAYAVAATLESPPVGAGHAR